MISAELARLHGAAAYFSERFRCVTFIESF
jgi:hypothetical protein